MAAAEVGLKGEWETAAVWDSGGGGGGCNWVRFFYLYVASLVGLGRGRWVVGRLGQIRA
jgi:hypothetical protein